MKYEVGQKVKIKSLDWYNRHTNGTEIDCGAYPFTSDMKEFCGQERIIANVCQECYLLLGIDDKFVFTDEMIEGLVEEETLIERVDDRGLPFNEWLSHKGAFHIPNGYELKDENGNVINATKIVLEKKKKEYPKTYEECCKVLDIEDRELVFNGEYRASKLYWKQLGRLNILNKLLICRDAYWKIAGDEMGLGKPWKPNDSSGYCTYAILRHTGHIRKSRPYADSELLEFPTEEMRDAFYENFKELIETVKEFL